MAVQGQYIADLVLICDGDECRRLQAVRLEADRPLSERKTLQVAAERFDWQVVFMRPRRRRGRIIPRPPRCFCPDCRRD